MALDVMSRLPEHIWFFLNNSVPAENAQNRIAYFNIRFCEKAIEPLNRSPVCNRDNFSGFSLRGMLV